MDYCNTIMVGAPRTVTDKLQQVLIAAARVITALGSLITAWVWYCTTYCIGSTFPTGFSSSWQWQFTSVWMATHHCIGQITASRSPVLTCSGICVSPTICLLNLVSGSTLTAVRHSQLLARLPGTLFRILSRIQQATHTVLGIYFKRTCSHDTRASSTLGVFNNNELYKPTH